MPLLQYDIAVVGEAKLRRSLRGIEQEFSNHARTVDRLGGGSRGGAHRSRSSASSGIRQQVSNATRGFEQIGRAARAAYMKEGRDRLAQERQTNRQIVRERERAAKQAANAEVAAARDADRRRRRFASGMATHVGRGFGNVAGVVTRGAGILGGLATGVALHNELGYRKSLADLSNQAYREGSGPSREQIMRQARDVTTRTGASGLGANATAAALREFVSKTGDFQTGAAILPKLAKVSVATGADPTDVASTAGEAMLQLQSSGVKGAAAIKELNKVLATMMGQGKEGSIEFKDLATIMGKLGAATTKFSGSVSSRFAQVGALAQLSKRGGASSPEEAATSMMRMSDDMVKNSKRFKAIGVDVFRRDKSGKAIGLRGQVDVLAEAFKASGGDIRKTSKLFGIRGQKGADAFFDIARNMGHGNVAAGLAAAQSAYKRFYNARVGDKELNASAKFAENQPGMKAAAAMEEFNRKVGTELVPVLTKLIPKFEEMIPKVVKVTDAIAKFASWALDHPAEGLGVIIAASITKSIAGAALGAAVKKAILAAMGGHMPHVPGGGNGSMTVATTAAVGGVLLAGDQASKLRKETGSTHSLMTMIPGFDKKGKFNSDQFIHDMLPTAGGIKAAKTLYAVGSDVVNYDKNMNRAARSRAAAAAGHGGASAGKTAGDELVSGANKAGDALIKKLNTWKPPTSTPNRHDPIVKTP